MFLSVALPSFQDTHNLFIRIGELKALSWEDVNLDKREIYVHKQLVESREISDDLSFGPREVHEKDRMKGNTQSGYKHEYLTDEAIEILREAWMLNPNRKYIFMPYGRVMNTNTFNDHLKKHCKECGIKYRSSHKIRFYTASVTYDGKNTRELSRQMGHSQVSTTIGYLRDVNQTEDLASLFSRLGKNAYKA